MLKQDKQGVRSARDLEQKYRFGEAFSEVKESLKVATTKAEQAVQQALKAYSEILQLSDSISLTVDNGETTAQIKLKVGDREIPATIDMKGLVTFSNLANADGTTVINGSNITTGQILADLIKAGTIKSKDGKGVVIDLDGGGGVFTATEEAFLEPTWGEVATIENILSGAVYYPPEKKRLYDRDGDGNVTANDLALFKAAAEGKSSLMEGWDKAQKSLVTVSIDTSNPTQAVKITGVNMWGRSIETSFGLGRIKTDGNINMQYNRITDLTTGDDDNDAVSVWYANNHYAPSGYGLGSSGGKLITNANLVSRTGWYYSSGAMANVPAGFEWGLLRNETNLTEQYQTIRSGNKIAIRTGTNQMSEDGSGVSTIFGEWVDASPASAFGLGANTAEQIDSPDQANKTGWYQTKGVIIPGISENPEQWWDLFVASSLLDDFATHQFIFDRYGTFSKNGASYLHRSKAGAGAWGEWEWINPPMQLDVEYRTSEKFCGRPVYAKIVDCGAFPDANEKIIYHNIDNIEYVISCTGFSDYVGLTLPYYGISNNEIFMYGSVHATSSAITVFTTQSHWQSYKCFAHLKYTKTTD